MNFFSSIAATTLIKISSVFSETIQLNVRFDNVQLSGAGVVGVHEGLFAVHDKYNSTNFEFDGNSLSIHEPDFNYQVSNTVGLLDLLITNSSTGFSFSDDGLFQLNGTSDKFYACSNSTVDPYHYSSHFGTFQLFYDYTPADIACAKVELVKEVVSKSSSTISTTASLTINSSVNVKAREWPSSYVNKSSNGLSSLSSHSDSGKKLSGSMACAAAVFALCVLI
ncbi:unnamed protein product [Ambrosiozyma monospora]|uniref:Unnamed protein product n=1 Tax=Ambrosiozyma monospora TaxID=43982 RepID=A0ACB5TEB1_AMBMO|nr:unnamed protein product [Ambrosiozyma monospora]